MKKISNLSMTVMFIFAILPMMTQSSFAHMDCRTAHKICRYTLEAPGEMSNCHRACEVCMRVCHRLDSGRNIDCGMAHSACTLK